MKYTVVFEVFDEQEFKENIKVLGATVCTMAYGDYVNAYYKGLEAMEEDMPFEMDCLVPIMNVMEKARDE